jgi:hypothetical protein
MLQPGDTTIIFLTLTMSTQTNATISPDHAASDPDPTADTVPSSSSHAKRRQEEADTPGDGTGTGGPAAKVARLASAEEKTKEQAGDETPESPLTTTENIVNLLKDLWSDDKPVIGRALKEIADIGFRDARPMRENELKMHGLGVQIAVFQVLQKHIGCLEIQKQGMRAIGNLTTLMPTRTQLGVIGCVEVILASMEKYPKSQVAQWYGCVVIGKLIHGMKGNAEHVEKSGGIALVIAAMKAHPNCLSLQGVGCLVLSYMSEWEQYRPLIVEAGGASAIVFVMEKYRHHPKLRKLAFIAMKILVTAPRSNASSSLVGMLSK